MTDASGTVIVLNWQGRPWLEDCLRTLLDQSSNDFRLLVVDNNSTDGSAAIAPRLGVELLQLGENLGFSKANNVGAAAASGRWLIFANNDMRFHRDFVATVSRRLFSDEKTFAVDVRQRDWNGDLSHGAVKIVPATWRSSFRIEESFPVAEAEVAFGNGGALGVRRDRFDAIGGWDERMFAGSEDIDLCWRGWLRGWVTVHVPKVLADAKIAGASSTGEGVAIRRSATVKGRLVFAAKHMPAHHAAREWAAVVPRTLMRRGLRRAAIRATVELPAILSDRRRLYADTSPRAQLAAMTRLG